MKVGSFIFRKCLRALNNGAEIICAEISVRYTNGEGRNKHVPNNFISMLKVGHSREQFEQWLEQLNVPYVEEKHNQFNHPFTQSVSGTIWFNDGSWLEGYQNYRGYKVWEYHSQPDIPDSLL